jgi:hypothetical protein
MRFFAVEELPPEDQIQGCIASGGIEIEIEMEGDGASKKEVRVRSMLEKQ